MLTEPFSWLHGHAATCRGAAVRLRGEFGTYAGSCLSPSGGFLASIDHRGKRYTVQVDADELVEIDRPE